MLSDLKADLKRYTNNSISIKTCFHIIFTQAVWAIAVYRFGRVCKKINFFPLTAIYFFVYKLCETITGISIPPDVSIGKGLYIGHFGQIFIHSLTKIGNQCSIAQGVTIGSLGLGKIGAPDIGNNVFIGSGAKVLGSIKIGDNVIIGADAVVIKDIPDNATVVGIPAKIVKINGLKNNG